MEDNDKRPVVVTCVNLQGALGRACGFWPDVSVEKSLTSVGQDYYLRVTWHCGSEGEAMRRCNGVIGSLQKVNEEA